MAVYSNCCTQEAVLDELGLTGTGIAYTPSSSTLVCAILPGVVRQSASVTCLLDTGVASRGQPTSCAADTTGSASGARPVQRSTVGVHLARPTRGGVGSLGFDCRGSQVMSIFLCSVSVR